MEKRSASFILTMKTTSLSNTESTMTKQTTGCISCKISGITRLVYSYYEDHELEQYGIDHDEADYGLYIMQDIRNNQLVALIKKVGIYIKGSLRSRGEIDCSELARFFGG